MKSSVWEIVHVINLFPKFNEVLLDGIPSGQKPQLYRVEISSKQYASHCCKHLNYTQSHVPVCLCTFITILAIRILFLGLMKLDLLFFVTVIAPKLLTRRIYFLGQLALGNFLE